MVFFALILVKELKETLYFAWLYKFDFFQIIQDVAKLPCAHIAYNIGELDIIGRRIWQGEAVDFGQANIYQLEKSCEYFIEQGFFESKNYACNVPTQYKAIFDLLYKKCRLEHLYLLIFPNN